MLIYSIQPASLYEKLVEGYTLQAVPDFELDDEVDHSFKNAYDWMVRQMVRKEVVGNAQDYPFWGWAHYGGQRARPDLRYERRATPQVMLTLEFLPTEVLLSDHDLWHSVLNNQYLARTERDSCHASWPREEIVESWQDIFGLYQSVSGDYHIKSYDPEWWGDPYRRQVQATFWELSMRNVKSVTHIAATRSPKGK